MTQSTHIKINRNTVTDTAITTSDLPDINKLPDGAVLFELDLFGLSTNNITYGVLGNTMGYWNFFPMGQEHSQLPIWGFGTIIGSNHPKFSIGDRYYGYFPMSSHLMVYPDKLTPFGFTDVNPERRCVHPIYDYYVNIQTDPSYKPEHEAMQVLYRPLFFTSFLLHDFLVENNYFEAKQLVITSASSKTAYGLAALLDDDKKSKGKDFKLVGITSSRNVGFVDSLGIYDEIVTYENFTTIDNNMRTAIVDHTGNQQLLLNISKHLGDAHAYTALIGAVQNDQLEGAPGEAKHGSFFFAPVQANKCIERWGHERFNQEYAGAWESFLDKVSAWVELNNIQGAEAIRDKYLELHSGSPSPKEGIIARFN